MRAVAAGHRPEEGADHVHEADADGHAHRISPLLPAVERLAQCANADHRI